MRLLKELPEIEPALKSGELSLSNVSALEHFFKNEQKHRQKPYSQAQKKELLGKVTGKSRRECDQLLAELAPEMPKTEQSRPISATQTEIRFTAQQALLAKFEKLKGLLSHRNPNPSYAELFEMLADLALKRLDPEQKQGRKREECRKEEEPVSATPPAESAKSHRATSLAGEERLASREPSLCSPALRSVPSSDQLSEPSRYIPQALRRTVWKRDQGQCTYVNQKTGVRCDSKHLLEIHHILDFSLGGEHTLDNLALRCQCHNLHAAVQTHGTLLMNRYLRGG